MCSNFDYPAKSTQRLSTGKVPRGQFCGRRVLARARNCAAAWRRTAVRLAGASVVAPSVIHHRGLKP
eukprot:10991813-Prorocentrum_lima.AAC.1